MKLETIPVLRLLRGASGARVALGSLALLLSVAALCLAPLPASDMDIWWLAAAGRAIAETHQAPVANVFSFAEPDHPWILHEGLYALVFDAGLRRMGPAFFSLFGFLGACATAAAFLAATLGRARHLLSAALLWGGALLGVFGHLVSPRPLYSSLLFAVVIAALAVAPRFSRRAVATAVLVELVWTNAHGSFPLGLALLAGGATFHASDRRRRALATALAAGATLANPYGLRIYALVARYTLGSDDVSALIRAHVGGFSPIWRAPPAFVDPGVACAFAIVVAAACASLRARADRAQALLALALLFVGALQVRHLALATLVSTVLVASAVDSRFAAPAATSPTRSESVRRVGIAILAPLLAGLLAFAFARRTLPADDWVSQKVGGPAFVRLARALPDGARAYAPFATTGLLLWLDSPRGVRVLYDARNDCYSVDLVALGFGLDEGTLTRDAIRSAFDRYGVDHAILQTGGALFAALSTSDSWTVVRQDGGWGLLARSPISAE